MKILTVLLASLFAMTAQAQTTFEHFTGTDEWPVFGEFPNFFPNIIEPGEFFCTGGGEPSGLFECAGGNGIHIRGTQMMSCATNSMPYDARVEGTVWFDIAANWDSSYTGPVSGNWRIVPGDFPGDCGPAALVDPDNFWQGTYTGKRELVLDPGLPPTWITTLKLVGYGVGPLLTGQKIKATELITTYTPVPLPWELLGLGMTGPEGVVDLTIITEY